ncbi:MAG TPA: spore coat associated protein CotJA [Methanosarcinales archaeon]|nr:spore coat associated protein CotJA [Methanosarcinales archaeon]
MNKYQYEHTYNPEMLVRPDFKIPVMPEEFELAIAYVPYQVMYKIYEPMKSLMKGTIFPELYRPYVKQKFDR